MKKEKQVDLSWLPPREQWDFRSVTRTECRIASHWEYAREHYPALMDSTKGHSVEVAAKLPVGTLDRNQMIHMYCPQFYRQAARELFPQAWTSLTAQQREKVVNSFLAAPVIQVRKMRVFLNRLPMESESAKAFIENSYAIIPNFARYGVGPVLKELEKWARKEAKCHQPAPRAKAAELPFDALKWLAVMRLDRARRKARVTVEKAQEAIKVYRRANPETDPNGVFPIYSSPGAWSKACTDAKRCLKNVMTHPSELLAELF